MNSINWDDLRYFLAVARAGSLSEAAKTLGSNQPTVGRHVNALESELGVTLFQRSVKGLSLTQEGQTIFEYSQTMQKTVVKIHRSIQAVNEDLNGSVSLALPEGLGVEIVAPVLNQFYQQYPYIHLNLIVSSNAANLSQGEADVAVRLFRPEASDLVIKSLGEMKLGLFASSKYKDDYGLPVSLKELSQHRVITYGEQLSTLSENQWLLKHTEEALQVLGTDSTLARFNATRFGVGISIQPVVMAKMNIELNQLLQKARIPSHKVWLVYHKDLRDIPRVRAVVDFISTYLSGMLV